MTDIKPGDKFRIKGDLYEVITFDPGVSITLIVANLEQKLTGSELASHRKQIEHICDNPKCGKTFTGYAHAKSCPDCSAHMRYIRHKAKKLKSGD